MRPPMPLVEPPGVIIVGVPVAPAAPPSPPRAPEHHPQHPEPEEHCDDRSEWKPPPIAPAVTPVAPIVIDSIGVGDRDRMRRALRDADAVGRRADQDPSSEKCDQQPPVRFHIASCGTSLASDCGGNMNTAEV